MALAPQIGLPVQYNIPAGSGPDLNTVYGAVITQINTDGTVNLTVFVDGGQSFTATEVPAQTGNLTTFYSMLAFS